MCLAVPSLIVSIDDVTRNAKISVMGVERTCSLRLVPNAKVGDYVLVHAGFAIQIIEEQDARETLELFAEMPDLLGDDFAQELKQASQDDKVMAAEHASEQ